MEHGGFLSKLVSNRPGFFVKPQIQIKPRLAWMDYERGRERGRFLSKIVANTKITAITRIYDGQNIANHRSKSPYMYIYFTGVFNTFLYL